MAKDKQAVDELTFDPIETIWIPISEIEPHPDALAFWGANDDTDANSDSSQDAGALKNSVARHSNALAALVARKEDAPGYWLLDGCGRMAGAIEGGRHELYCTVLDIAPEFFQKLMMEVNMQRHRVSTPSRVLRYMELYQNEVLTEADRNADPTKTGAMGGRGSKGSSEGTALFTQEAIRKRLHCRKQEVSGGILLLKCKRDGAVPYVDAQKRWQLRPATDEELMYRDELAQCIRKGKGNVTLSRWAQGFAGKIATQDKPRGKTDYAKVLDTATTKLNTAFTNWHEVGNDARAGLIREFCKVMMTMPADFDRSFLDVIKRHYPNLFEKKGSVK